MTGRGPRTPALLLPLLATVLVACAETIYEDGAGAGAGEPPQSSAAASTVAATIVGTAAELLPQLSDEAVGLSRLMIDDGDDEASAERIDDLWQAVRQEVSAVRPELVADFDANVRRCQAAVRFRRAADADKAAANLRALVDAYLASS